MNVYETKTISQLVDGNPYNGRGIILGQTPDGRRAVAAYFIMGRSANSRNRVFRKEGDDVTIYPYDPSKVEDPSLIIYSPVRVWGNRLIVTNGDQTDTIYDGLMAGKDFRESLSSRAFEPDGPNWTPRISGMITFREAAQTAGQADGRAQAPDAAQTTGAGAFAYSMSILKSGDAEGTICNRFTYDYQSLPGTGHFLHTYMGDGKPLPTFVGEPRRVAIPDSMEDFAQEIWAAIDKENRISLYVRSVDLTDGTWKDVLINGNEQEG